MNCDLQYIGLRCADCFLCSGTKLKTKQSTQEVPKADKRHHFDMIFTTKDCIIADILSAVTWYLNTWPPESMVL